ncbi:MAG: porin [Herminiimonas sp.]|nr:porin [Herminiimonas sp.]
MKKSLLALAVLGAFAGVAQAQTSVTIYGSFDAGVRNLSNVNAAGDDRLTMGSTGTYNSNRLGFRGVEDLGGGLNAHFNLESAFNSGTGAADTTRFWGRTASVGIGGAWGSIDLGRQYSVNFRTIGVYDPFNYKYTGIIPVATQGGLTRYDNDIQYTGTFGPITARAEYALGEVAGSARNGSTQAVGVTYAGGPFAAGAAYTAGKRNVAGAAAAPSFQDMTNWTVGGAFTTGPFRVALGYADQKQETGTVVAEGRSTDKWVGASYNVTPALGLSLAYYRTEVELAGLDGRRNLAIFGATYALSKRTNFYADIDNSKLTGLSRVAGQTRQTGVSVGINHLF